MRKLSLIFLLLGCAARLRAASAYADVPGSGASGAWGVSYERDGHGDGTAYPTTVYYNLPAYVPAGAAITKVTYNATGLSGSCGSVWAGTDWGGTFTASWSGQDVSGSYPSFTNINVGIVFHPVMPDHPTYDEDPTASCSFGASTSSLRVYWNTAPTRGTFSPTTVTTGTWTTFTITASDVDGGSGMYNLWININTSNVIANGCYFQIWGPSSSYNNQINLADNDGQFRQTTFTPGSGGSNANSQCSIRGTGTSISYAGNNITFTLSMYFYSGFTGTKNVYQYVNDAYTGTGWGSIATLAVSLPNTAPITVSSSGLPSNFNTGVEQTIVGTVRDADGYANINYFHILLNYGVDGAYGCYFLIYPNSNAVYLMNDTGDNWGGGATFGAAATLSNSGCKLNAATSSRSISGTDASATLKVTFLPGVFSRPGRPASTVNSYLYVIDAASATSNWQGPYQAGTARSGPKLIVNSMN